MCKCMSTTVRVSPFRATGLFQYPLKTSENPWFSDVFRGYLKKQVARNWLMVRFNSLSSWS